MSRIRLFRVTVWDSEWRRNIDSGWEWYAVSPVHASLSQKSQSAAYHKRGSRPPTRAAASRRKIGAEVVIKFWTSRRETNVAVGMSRPLGRGHRQSPSRAPRGSAYQHGWT